MTPSMDRRRYNNAPFTLKECRKCKVRFPARPHGRACINCNVQYANLNKKALLTEEQLMDLFDLQWLMMEVNQVALEKERAADVENEQRELDELKARIRAKYGLYEKALEVETHPQGPGIVQIGSSTVL